MATKQKQIQQQKKLQAELEYITQMFSQDLMNVTGILAETQSVYKVFQKEKNHQMMAIHYNRCVTQMSLSNGIHKDLIETIHPSLNNKLIEQRSRYQAIYEKVRGQLVNDEELIKLAQIHSENTVNQQNPPFFKYIQKETNRVAQFTNELVQKIFDHIALVDQQRNEFLSGKRKADCINEELVLSLAQSRADIGLLKTFTNFYLEKVYQFVDNLQDDQKLIIQQYFEGNFTQKLQEIHLQELNQAVWTQDDLIHLFHRDVETRLEILGYFQLFCMKLALEPKTAQNFSQQVTNFLAQVIYNEMQDQIHLFNQKYQTFIKQQQEPLNNLDQKQKDQMEEVHNIIHQNQEIVSPIQTSIQQPAGDGMQVEAQNPDQENDQKIINAQISDNQFNNNTKPSQAQSVEEHKQENSNEKQMESADLLGLGQKTV